MNPRIGRPDKVDSIVESMRNDGYRPEKPMLVRPLESGYQIIGGHSRNIAAQEAGIDQVFCAIESMDDDEAILRMGSDNINDPFPWFSVCLYVVQNSVKDSKKGLSRTQLIRAATGKDGNAAEVEARRKGDAGEVIQFLREQSVINDGLLDTDTNRTLHIAEIHAAPKWLWPALVRQMIESGWTVQVTRDKVGAFKEVADPPSWADSGRIADALVSGAMKIAEVARLQKLVDNAKVTGEFRSHLLMAIESESPSFLNAESYFGGEGDIGGRNYAQCAKYGIGREVIAKMLDGTEKEGAIQQALASLPLTARRKRGLELQAEEERRKAEELRAEADRINAEREQSRIAAPQNLSPKIRLFFAQSDFYPAATYPQSAGQHLYRTTFVVLYRHEKPTHCP